jgi:hypothetical protein
LFTYVSERSLGLIFNGQAGCVSINFALPKYFIKNVRQVALTLNIKNFEIYAPKNCTDMSLLNKKKNYMEKPG